jgi:hypothetical protein
MAIARVCPPPCRRKPDRGAEEKLVEPLPPGLDLERHVLLSGRGRHVTYRRVLFGLVCLLPLLALLNVFGQHPSTSAAAGPAGTLKVQAPTRLRGGLMFQVRIDVTATRTIREPQLVLGPGWWEEMTENSIAPDPLDQSTSNGRVTLSYGRLDAGQKLTVWLEYQVNPVNVGHRPTNVLLTDGPRPIAQVHRELTVLP